MADGIRAPKKQARRKDCKIFSRGNLGARSNSKTCKWMRIEVGAIAPLAVPLFESCRRSALLGEATLLCLDIEAYQVTLLTNSSNAPTDRPLILLPIAAMCRELKKLLIEPDESEFNQREFPWPLSSVK